MSVTIKETIALCELCNKTKTGITTTTIIPGPEYNYDQENHICLDCYDLIIIKEEKTRHETKNIVLDNKLVQIDKPLVKIIKELNKIGLKTLYSCQGSKTQEAFIVFDLNDIANIKTEIDNQKLVIRWYPSWHRKDS